MPSQKRRRPTTANDDAPPPQTTHSRPSASLAGFTLLPLELRQLIVEVACHSPSSSSSSCLSPFEADNGTMFNLALVCREINAQVTPLLWGTVAITRPSALYALHQALLASPERAKMITSLHIGPQDTLPSYWWPLSRTVVDAYQYTAGLGPESGFTSHWIATSLDKTLLPSGCVSREAWRWDRSTPGCRGAAIYEAIEVIKATLGLDFRAHGYASPTTIAPVFEAQAALDMYLTRLHSVEEDNPVLVQMAKPGAPIPLACRNRQCQHYPALFITGAPRSARSRLFPARLLPPVEPPSNAFVISYPQLLCHIARRGAITDRFDHPLALARSQFNVIIDVPAAKGRQAAYEPSKATYKLHSGTWDVRQHEVGQWAGHVRLREAAKRAGEEGREEDQRCCVATAATATFGTILGLSRDVIDLATNVQNLSLTGYLESAIVEKTLQPSLSRLSLGPAPPCWAASLPVGRLEGVKQLRIGGRPMTTYEAWTLAFNTPRLERLDWSMAQLYANRARESIMAVIKQLLHTKPGPAVVAHATPTAEESSQVGGGSSEASTPASLILAQLHRLNYDEVLDKAPSREIKAAWLSGKATSTCYRRLLIKQSAAAAAVVSAAFADGEDAGGDPSHNSRSLFWEELYKEGRDYWRGGQAEAGHGDEEAKGEEEGH